MDFLTNDLKYIERHSRQLLLPGWSLELQRIVDSLIISVPYHPVLIAYLLSLGANKFHAGSGFPTSPQLYSWNLEETANFRYSYSQADVSFTNSHHEALDTHLKISIYSHLENENIKIVYRDRMQEEPQTYIYKNASFDCELNYQAALACCVFTHKIRENFSLFL